MPIGLLVAELVKELALGADQLDGRDCPGESLLGIARANGPGTERDDGRHG